MLSSTPYCRLSSSSCKFFECHSRRHEAISSTSGSRSEVGVSSPILSIGTGAGGFVPCVLGPDGAGGLFAVNSWPLVRDLRSLDRSDFLPGENS